MLKWELKDIKECHRLSKIGRGYHINTEMIDQIIELAEQTEKYKKALETIAFTYREPEIVQKIVNEVLNG